MSTEKQNLDLIELKVPGDGHCLFWSVLFGYLLPIMNDPQEYIIRVNKILRGVDQEEIEHCANYLKCYLSEFIDANGQNYILAQDNPVLLRIVKLFRRNVVNYMEEHKEAYQSFMEDDQPLEVYAKEMKKSASWGGEVEMRAMSEWLEIHITQGENHYGNQYKNQVQLNYTIYNPEDYHPLLLAKPHQLNKLKTNNHYTLFIGKDNINRLLKDSKKELMSMYEKSEIKSAKFDVLSNEKYLPFKATFKLGVGISDADEMKIEAIMSPGSHNCQEVLTPAPPYTWMKKHLISSSEDITSLKKQFVSGEANYYAFKASGSYGKLDTFQTNSQTITCLIMHVIDGDNSVHIQSPILPQSVLDDIEKYSLDEFLQLYGSHYLAGYTKSAVFFGIVEINLTESRLINEMKAKASLGLGTIASIGLGGNLEGEFRQELNSVTTQYSLNAELMCKGVRLAQTVGNINDLVKAHQEFVSKAQEANMPSKAICKPWTSFPEFRKKYFTPTKTPALEQVSNSKELEDILQKMIFNILHLSFQLKMTQEDMSKMMQSLLLTQDDVSGIKSVLSTVADEITPQVQTIDREKGECDQKANTAIPEVVRNYWQNQENHNQDRIYTNKGLEDNLFEGSMYGSAMRQVTPYDVNFAASSDLRSNPLKKGTFYLECAAMAIKHNQTQAELLGKLSLFAHSLSKLSCKQLAESKKRERDDDSDDDSNSSRKRIKLSQDKPKISLTTSTRTTTTQKP